MLLNDDACYQALLARDARFDGLFFTAVRSTGIYCRPICAARTPGRNRVRFFTSAAAAESAGYRPCLRCRPELAPGLAPADAAGRTARQAAARIEAGALRDGGSMERLATELGLSSRQLRRVVKQELGVSPIQLAQTGRLLLAKQLLAESTLPIIAVADASGFESVRRFNALFRKHYGWTPSTLRRGSRRTQAGDCVRLTLSYRPPLAWPEMLRFLAERATRGVEHVAGAAYRRTASIGDHRGWLSVEPISQGKPWGSNSLEVELATSLLPVLPFVLARLRHLFDLAARPDVIDARLASSPALTEIVRCVPGLRVPGAFDGFELAVRAVLGQQIAVRAATTLAGRLATACGEPIETPFAALTHLPPAAERLARARPASLIKLGLRSAIADTIRGLSVAVLEERVTLEAGADPETAIDSLQACPGVGPWTAHYVAMRALRWPDAFPAADLGLLKSSGAPSARTLLEMAESWRPWRAYAAMYLWESLTRKSSLVNAEDES